MHNGSTETGAVAGCDHAKRCRYRLEHDEAIRWGALFKPATARIVEAWPFADGYCVRFDVDPPDHAGHYVPNSAPDEAYRTMVTIPTVHQQAIIRLVGPNGHEHDRNPFDIDRRDEPDHDDDGQSGLVRLSDLFDKDGNPPDFPAQSGGNLCIITTADPPFGLIGQGTVHWLTGDSGTGKTLWMCAVCLTVVIQDSTIEVVIINYASSRDDIMKRLIQMGMYYDLAQRITYTDTITDLQHAPDDALVVVEEATGLYEETGLSVNSMSDTQTVVNKLRGPAKQRTVIVADHRSKDLETRGRWAAGSNFKLGIVDGYAYLLDQQPIMTPGEPTNFPLQVVKEKYAPIRARGVTDEQRNDRPTWIGNLTMTLGPSGEFTDNWNICHLEALPASRRGRTSRRRRNTRMDKLLVWSRLTAGEAATASDASRYLGVSKNAAASYLRDLAADGALTVETGPNRTKLYRLRDADVISLNPQ